MASDSELYVKHSMSPSKLTESCSNQKHLHRRMKAMRLFWSDLVEQSEDELKETVCRSRLTPYGSLSIYLSTREQGERFKVGGR